jgi:hypothetical protein
LAGVSARILTEKDKWERVAQCLHLRKLSTTSRESRRRVMPKYQIIEGQYNYVLEADNYTDALQMVAEWDEEEASE